MSVYASGIYAVSYHRGLRGAIAVVILFLCSVPSVVQFLFSNSHRQLVKSMIPNIVKTCLTLAHDEEPRPHGDESLEHVEFTGNNIPMQKMKISMASLLNGGDMLTNCPHGFRHRQRTSPSANS